MNEELIEKARQFVEDACKSESSLYGLEPYVGHFVPMHSKANELAEHLGADIEVVRLAAWLHDVGSIIQGRVDHHINGARIAGEKLKEWGYDNEKIEKVKKCILNHRGSVNEKKESIEEQIIADADALVNFDNLGGIFKAAIVYENLDQFEARESVRQKLSNCYEKLSDSSKGMIKDKYDAAMLLLGGKDGGKK